MQKLAKKTTIIICCIIIMTNNAWLKGMKKEPSHSKARKKIKIQIKNGMECSSDQCAKRCGIPFHWCNWIGISSQILLLGIHLIESSEKWTFYRLSSTIKNKKKCKKNPCIKYECKIIQNFSTWFTEKGNR